MTVSFSGVTSPEQREALEDLIAQVLRIYVETPFVIIGASGIVKIKSAEEAGRNIHAVVNNPRASVKILIDDSPHTAYRIARTTVYGTPEIAVHLVGWFRHEKPDFEEGVPDGPNLRAAINGCLPFIEGLNPDEDSYDVSQWLGGSVIQLAHWVIDNIFTQLCIRGAYQMTDIPNYGSLSGKGLFHTREKHLAAVREAIAERNRSARQHHDGGHIM